jgi:integrase
MVRRALHQPSHRRRPDAPLRVDHLEELYLRLATDGGKQGQALAPKTVLDVHMIIRAALEAAMDRQLLDRNVAHAAHARLPRAGGTAARVWTASELGQFLDASQPHRRHPLLHLTAHTRMRRGEVVGLKWSDLDPKAKRLSIQRTLQRVAGRPVEFGVKTRTSRGCIDLDPNTVGTLREWRRRLSDEGHPHGADDWTFCNQGGRFLNPESASQLVSRIIATTPLPRIRFHDVYRHHRRETPGHSFDTTRAGRHRR